MTERKVTVDIKRYDVVPEDGHIATEDVESPDGEWVRYSDVRATLTEHAALEEENAELRAWKAKVIAILNSAPRIGDKRDEPEGSRYIQISDTAALILAAEGEKP